MPEDEYDEHGKPSVHDGGAGIWSLGAAREQVISTGDPITVFAAGAVLWRAGPDGHTEIALVHRPRYNDWSLPKGKLDPGETPAHAAAREIVEETGFCCELSRFLTQVTYPVPAPDGGRTGKLVHYFAAQACDGSFSPNEEVDELRWMRIEHARRQLTYVHDERVLDAFDRLPAEVATVLLVRHAKAGKRSEWAADDTLRPLSESGRRQRDALRTLLPLFGPERAYTAPRLRCRQTIAPVAEGAGIGVSSEPRLSEEGYWQDPQAGVQRLLRIAAEPGVALVCSQGAVIPDLVARLATAASMDLGAVRSKKGSVWTLTFRRYPHSETHVRENGSGQLLRLAAADYLDDPVVPDIAPLAAEL